METRKNYQAMSDAERQDWLDDYRQWLVDFPKIESLKAPSADMNSIVEQGLALLSAFPYCKSFVSETLRCKDYPRRLKIIRRYADRVSADLRKLLNRDVDLSDPNLLIPHVGRPTKEQAAARALARQKEQEIKEKSPNLFNSSPQPSATDPATSDPAASPASPASPTGIPAAETEDIPSFVPLAFAAAPHTHFPSIAEVRWLLSPSLQTETDSIRDLRSRFEEASTRAKQMAEDGRNPEDIKPFAQEAALRLKQYEDIYARVDAELQTAYVRLKEDAAYIAKMSGISRMNCKELRSFLRPFWDKLSVDEKTKFKAEIIEQIKANDPAQAAARKKEEERKASIAKIIKYLQRKDKPNTLKRVVGIRRKISQLRELIGSEADLYLPILAAAKEDYEANFRTPDDEPLDLSEPIPVDSPDPTSEDDPEDTPEPAPETLSEDTPESAPDPTPAVAPETLSEDIPEPTPEPTPEPAPVDTSDL